MKATLSSPRSNKESGSVKGFPFAAEFITNAEGRISKVILNIDDYESLVEAVEDEGLRRAIQQVRDQKPLSLQAALKRLRRR